MQSKVTSNEYKVIGRKGCGCRYCRTRHDLVTYRRRARRIMRQSDRKDYMEGRY